MPVVPATWEAEAEGSVEPGVEAAVSHDQSNELQPGRKNKTVLIIIIIVIIQNLQGR